MFAVVPYRIGLEFQEKCFHVPSIDRVGKDRREVASPTEACDLSVSLALLHDPASPGTYLRQGLPSRS